MDITTQQNEKAIRKLKNGISRSYDIFMNGAQGIRPGDIRTYGAICGQKQVLAERLKLQKELLEQESSYEK